MDAIHFVLIGLAVWLVLISLVAVFFTRKDKSAAGKGNWRVKESTLLIISALGGSVAMLLTMHAIRHKTKHKKFMWGIPAIIFLQIVVAVALVLLWWHFWR
ncbi:MAG: DUF1294 domain-containing protein [Firmicutes bacterium]|nr:DUF1294 domain-containing protein [Bacillota bacterium]